MEYNNSQEYKTAQSRITLLLGQIRDQINEIDMSTDTGDATAVDDVIAEQDKSSFIFKLTELVNAYRDRDALDEREAYIEKLKAEVETAKRQGGHYFELWSKELKNVTDLESAIKSLVEVLTRK